MQSVLNKFQYNYLLISESLRIMNEVMVLLNPRILQQETASIIQPLNESSVDVVDEKAMKIDELDAKIDTGSVSLPNQSPPDVQTWLKCEEFKGNINGKLEEKLAK